MRYSRMLVALGLLAAVGLAVVLLSRSATRPVRAAASPLRVAAAPAPVATPVGPAVMTPRTQLRGALKQVLHDYLYAPRFQTLPAPSISAPGGTTCFVAGGGCSLTPCVVPVQSVTTGPAVVSAVAGAAVLRPTRPVPSRCPSGSTPPRSPLVSGP